MKTPDDFSSLFAAIYRRGLMVVLVLSASVSSTWYYLGEVPPMYRARAVLLVPSEMPTLSLSGEANNVPSGPVLPDSSEDTRIGLLGLFRSSRVVNSVAEALTDVPVDYLLKHVVADIDADQQLVVVATDVDSSKAVAIANQFVHSFIGEMKTMVERAPRKSYAILIEEEKTAWEAYAQADLHRREMLNQLGSPDPNVDISLLSEERLRLQTALLDLSVEESKLLAQQPILESAISSRPEYALARRTVSENPAYQKALDAAMTARTDLALKLVKYRDNHVEVERARLRLQQAEQQVAIEAANRMVTSSEEFQPDDQARELVLKMVELEAGMAGIAPARARLDEQLQVVEASLAPLPEQRLVLARLDAELERLREHASRVSERKDELRLALDVGFDFSYFDEQRLARLETVQEVPNRNWAIVVSVIAGLIGGILLALVAEIISRSRKRSPY